MHKELYDEYEEFQEAGMVLENKIGFRLKDIETKWKNHENKLNQQWKDRENKLNQQWKDRENKLKDKIFDLLSQGYMPEEVKRLLAEESTVE
jgi:hypothetical protein